MKDKLFRIIPNKEYDENGGCFPSCQLPLKQDKLYLILDVYDKGGCNKITVLDLESLEKVTFDGDLLISNL